jgi:hypothetical protein
MSNSVENVEDVLTSIRRLVADTGPSVTPIAEVVADDRKSEANEEAADEKATSATSIHEEVSDDTFEEAPSHSSVTREALILTSAFRVDPNTELEAHDVDSSTPDADNLRSVLAGHAAANEGLQPSDLPPSRLHFTADEPAEAAAAENDNGIVAADMENDKFRWDEASLPQDYYEDEEAASAEPQWHSERASGETELAPVDEAQGEVEWNEDDLTDSAQDWDVDSDGEDVAVAWDEEDDSDGDALDARAGDTDHIPDAEVIDDQDDSAEHIEEPAADDMAQDQSDLTSESDEDDHHEDHAHEDQAYEGETLDTGDHTDDADEDGEIVMDDMATLAGAAAALSSDDDADHDAAIDAQDDGASDEVVLDEDALRAMVAEIVQQELSGALGEKITRNMRKLIRREVHRAISTKEFE